MSASGRYGPSRVAGPARVAALACLVAGAATAIATPRVRLGPGPVSSVIYTEHEIRLRFDHALHVGEVEMACPRCHTLAATSRSPRDNLLPQETACVECHGESTRPAGRGPDATEDRCRYCHPRAGSRVLRSLAPPGRISFSHAAHQPVADCVRCHTRVPVRDLATIDDLPGMRLCIGCHDGRQASGRCITCHHSQPDGVLRTDFGARQLTPPDWMDRIDHGGGWEEDHGLVAVERRSLCAACHRDHECLACHDGSVRPREVHPGDWLAEHAIEARAREQRCESCHRGQTFCRSCHLRAGVAQSSPAGRVDSTAAQVHRDPDWARGLDSRHGAEARRALQSCVSCHSGQDCVACHAFVNPHPPGFRERCRALTGARARACASCHESTEGLCD
mgnify:CR=1 FL=1